MEDCCRYCGGQGRVVQEWIDPDGQRARREVECPACRSAGELASDAGFELLECPHCATRVAVMADGTCPACRANVNDTSGPVPERVPLRIRQGERLPLVCFHCGSPATEYFTYRVTEPSLDEFDHQVLRGAISLLTGFVTGFFFWIWRIKPRLFVHLPRCKGCRTETPTCQRINFEERWMTLDVHRALRQEVQKRS